MLFVIDDCHRDAMLAQKVEERRRAKALMPHLDHMPQGAAADLLRQQFQKRREIVGVERFERRELPEKRPELVAEFGQAAAEEALDAVPGLGERAAALRYIARPFQRKDKPVRRLAAPFLKARRRLRTVEGAVDLDRGDVPAGIGQFFGLAQPRRVKGAAPRREDPAADAGADRAGVALHARGYKLAPSASKEKADARQSRSGSRRGAHDKAGLARYLYGHRVSGPGHYREFTVAAGGLGRDLYAGRAHGMARASRRADALLPDRGRPHLLPGAAAAGDLSRRHRQHPAQHDTLARRLARPPFRASRLVGSRREGRGHGLGRARQRQRVLEAGQRLTL